MLEFIPDYKTILNSINEEDIAYKYLGMVRDKVYHSFFRNDKNPSAFIYYSMQNNRLYYTDYRYNLSVPNVICNLRNISFYDFRKLVVKDFNLTDFVLNDESSMDYNNIENPVKPKKNNKKSKTIIRVKYNKKSLASLRYYKQFGIDLKFTKFANIYPITKFWIFKNGISKKYNSAKLSFTYNYYSKNNILLRKIYQPDDNFKWASNVDKSVIQNYKALFIPSDTLIITSSLKDCGTIMCNLNIPAIAPNSETNFISTKLIKHLQLIEKYKRIIIWFDNDYAGINYSKKRSKEFGIEYVYNPLGYPKDQSDFYKKYGKKEFIQMSKYILNK